MPSTLETTALGATGFFMTAIIFAVGPIMQSQEDRYVLALPTGTCQAADRASEITGSEDQRTARIDNVTIVTNEEAEIFDFQLIWPVDRIQLGTANKDACQAWIERVQTKDGKCYFDSTAGKAYTGPDGLWNDGSGVLLGFSILFAFCGFSVLGFGAATHKRSKRSPNCSESACSASSAVQRPPDDLGKSKVCAND